MRRIVAAFICAVFAGCALQSPIAINPQMLVPSPLGVVLTVGKWIYDSSTRQEVYYIEVAGDGSSVDQARNNGFRLAVEQALGTLISSETEVQNGKIVRDEIISYASGYVDRFEIVSQQKTQTGFRVAMRVWVKKSALSNRLLNRTEHSNQVDGPRASVQLETLNRERIVGDQLLQQVLNDFPKRAFDIEFKSTDVIRQNRASQMEISFRLMWNKDYLRSLWTALNAISYRGPNVVSIIGVNSGSIFGFGGQARFDDMQKLRMVASTFIGTTPAVMVTVRGRNSESLYSACFFYQELDHFHRYNITEQRFVQISATTAFVDGSYKMRSRIQLPINPALLNQVSRVDLDVVPNKSCPNPSY
jgi:hypothetical protein